MTGSTRPTAGRRRLAATALAALALALTAGCGAGPQAHTALQVPTVPGANKEINVEGGRLMVRNVLVSYSPAGYRKGGQAPLELRLFNDTPKPVRLVGVTSSRGPVLLFGAPRGGAASPAPTATGAASPTATRSAAPAGSPVNLEVPANGYLVLAPDTGQYLQIAGLTEDLPPGKTVELSFQFSNGTEITNVLVPISTPSSPAPRSPLVFEEGGEGAVGHD